MPVHVFVTKLRLTNIITNWRGVGKAACINYLHKQYTYACNEILLEQQEYKFRINTVYYSFLPYAMHCKANTHAPNIISTYKRYTNNTKWPALRTANS